MTAQQCIAVRKKAQHDPRYAAQGRKDNVKRQIRLKHLVLEETMRTMRKKQK